MNLKVSIIILNWNGLKDTLECLESLQKIDYLNYEVVVVDNNSSGDDVKVIKEKFGDFIHKIIINENNLGFSGGNNEGIKYALETGADYILLLNNDTIVEPDFLDELINKSTRNPNVGILTPMINYYLQRNIIWSAGGYISKIKASGFSYGYNKEYNRYCEDGYRSFASGCCMLIKREVIKDIGMLDKNYFLYIEDTDYCQRAIKAGYKIYYVGSSRIYHKVFTTTRKNSLLLPIYYSTRNRLYFAKKNLGLYFYFATVYLVIVFSIKIIIMNKCNRELIRKVFLSFKDYFANNMGKTNIFENNRY